MYIWFKFKIVKSKIWDIVKSYFLILEVLESMYIIFLNLKLKYVILISF